MKKARIAWFSPGGTTKRLAEPCPDLAGCDVIYLGFPIWWYTAPTIVNAFLESGDFRGKTIVPFATSGGSGFGETEAALRVSAPGASFKPGRVLSGRAGTDELRRWVAGLGL